MDYQKVTNFPLHLLRSRVTCKQLGASNPVMMLSETNCSTLKSRSDQARVTEMSMRILPSRRA
jgi:hypothetical protein